MRRAVSKYSKYICRFTRAITGKARNCLIIYIYIYIYINKLLGI
jgi:hypothetical protein